MKADVFAGQASSTTVSGKGGTKTTVEGSAIVFGVESMLGTDGVEHVGRTGGMVAGKMWGTGFKLAAGLEYGTVDNDTYARGYGSFTGSLADQSLKLKLDSDLGVSLRLRTLTPLAPMKIGAQTTLKLDLSPTAREQASSHFSEFLWHVGSLLSM
jgi:hypothetical protein